MKKYDPLWELVDEKVPLRGVGVDIDVRCPECHVVLHVSPEVTPDDPVECGLCGAALTVRVEGDRATAEFRG